MNKVTKIQQLNKGGYNVAWMVPFNMVAFSALAVLGLRYGLIILVPSLLIYFTSLYVVGNRVEARVEVTKTVKKSKKSQITSSSKSKKSKFVLKSAYSV